MRDVLSQAADLLRRGRSLAIFLVLCTLIASFAHQAVKGDHGLERRAQIKQRIADMEAERDRLAAKRARLERDVALMRAAANRSNDLAEEQARALLNLARPDDIIILDPPRGDD
ncbi:FtsB family cell division protein [Dichotomicrobium thermohalophilum]|uniref:Cell division protein FtsB n=1 Tax=Dichotomicrobium thermohalophilum TaxID=933063 RepID=A0A397Q633_9HYPH|nr:septum formation initiator family protein [Dichotomicrobium thermohalophilum]RIA56508.1 cell division protein FtsB [Dichotomicrobium thermohalophilum]